MKIGIVGLLACVPAFGSIVVTVSPSNAGSASVNGSNDVTFTRSTAYSGVADVYIRGTASDNARFIQTFGADASYQIRLHIVGDSAQGATRFGTVQAILKQSPAIVHLTEVFSAGDLGTSSSSDMAVRVDSINSVNILGSS